MKEDPKPPRHVFSNCPGLVGTGKCTCPTDPQELIALLKKVKKEAGIG